MADDGAVLADIAVPASFARDSPLALALNVAAAGAGGAPYQDDLSHWRACRDNCCARCHFEQGFRGELRRGGRPGTPDASKAWSQRFTFDHPIAGLRTWLAVSPYNSGHFGVGCWVCATFTPEKFASTFSRLQVTSRDCMTPSSFKLHTQSKGHVLAVRRMHLELTGNSGETRAGDPATGVLTGVSDDVPRLDRFYLAGVIVARHDTYSDFQHYAQATAIASALPQAGDFSRRVCQQMVYAMAEPLVLQDQAVMRAEPW